jgi:HEAT repeat protein
MAFYDLSKDERLKLVEEINGFILNEVKAGKLKKTLLYFSDDDTYIRKSAYLSIGKIYKRHKKLRKKIIVVLERLSGEEDFKVRQTSINAAGEIGILEFEAVERFFDKGLFDEHHSVRNAVIGSIKKMGEKNPKPVLKWARKFLHHEDKEIRREICHGIELRGRTHPEDILPMLKELQNDKTARVKNTLVHVLGQIAYKKGCLQTVIAHLKTWDNQEVVEKAIEEIIDVHDRYKDFAVMTQKQAKEYINKNF